MLAIWKRSLLPPSNIDYLRFYCTVYFHDSTSPKQVLPLLPENCDIDYETGTVDIKFVPKKQLLSDTIYFFFGESHCFSTVEFTMINRSAEQQSQALFSEIPPRMLRQKQQLYHFGSERGFKVRISTLGPKQVTVVAQYLNLPVESFYSSRTISQSHAQRFYTSEDVDSLLQQSVQSLRQMMVGEVVEIKYQCSINELFKAAFESVKDTSAPIVASNDKSD